MFGRLLLWWLTSTSSPYRTILDDECDGAFKM
jgi:hypothetical protein